MRLDALLRLANDVRIEYAPDTPEGALAREVLDLLGEAQPCTFEPPCTDQPGVVAILDGGGDPMYEFTPGEARAYAAMLLRAADEAERG